MGMDDTAPFQVEALSATSIDAFLSEGRGPRNEKLCWNLELNSFQSAFDSSKPAKQPPKPARRPADHIALGACGQTSSAMFQKSSG
mmetsp:Transcript_5304/g.9563  ORF Transcript_5304/g.9563 Transcript_5304/m.9563 type:complete len:86 (+) Transcript_5304:204-461(+)